MNAYFKPQSSAQLIPFSSVAVLAPSWETPSIYRRDGQRTLSVLAYPEFGRTAAEVSRHFLGDLRRLGEQLPRGYRLEFGGENEQRNEAEFNLLSAGVYALLIIVMLLVLEFRSLRLTMLVMAATPLSIGGAMLALWLTGWPLNFMAIMGIMVLAGVVVNDSIVLIHGFECRRRAGEPLQELVVNGTLEDSRHLLAVAATDVAGFLPLAFSPSMLWPPLAIVIIGGLTIATGLTLLAIPAAYTLLRYKDGVR